MTFIYGFALYVADQHRTTDTLKQTDRYFKRLDERFLNTRLSEKLKKQSFRRRIAFLSALMLMTTGFLLGFAVWSFIAPNPVTPFEKLLRALFWVSLVLAMQVEPLLTFSIRSAIEWPGQLYDERQKQLNMEARSSTRSFVLTLFGVTILLGLGMLIVIAAEGLSFSHPHYGGIPIFSGIAITFFMLAKNADHLLLAWQLPDEPADDEGF